MPTATSKTCNLQPWQVLMLSGYPNMDAMDAVRNGDVHGGDSIALFVYNEVTTAKTYEEAVSHIESAIADLQCTLREIDRETQLRTFETPLGEQHDGE